MESNKILTKPMETVGIKGL